MSYRTFSKLQTYSQADVINSKKLFHLNKNIQFYKSFSESFSESTEKQSNGCSDENYNFNSIEYYNEESCCNLTNDYKSHSTIRASMCLNFNYVKNVSIPYILHLNNIKSHIRLCEIKNVCDKSPINIIQGKTSYNCNTNIEDYDCKNPLKLYPHGLYACDSFTCTTCEEPLLGLREEGCCRNETLEDIIKREEFIKREELAKREELSAEELAEKEAVIKREKLAEKEEVVSENIGEEINSVSEESASVKITDTITENIRNNQTLGKRRNKKDTETNDDKTIYEPDNEITDAQKYQNADIKIIGYKIERESERVDKKGNKKEYKMESEFEIGNKIVKKTVLEIENGYKIERKKQNNELDFGYKIIKKHT
jgi:hypothetical protein